MCEDVPGSGNFSECSNDDICGTNITWYVDWTSPLSLDNWSQTLDLMCVDDASIDRISTVYYFGEIFGCICIARIPDLLGRRWPFTISLIL